MKKVSLLLLSFAALLVASCSSNDNSDVLKYVSANTMAVARVNLSQLDEKLPKEAIAKDKTKMSDSERKQLELLANAGDNGIDIDEPMYVLFDYVDNTLVTSVIVTLDDRDVFQKNFSEKSGSKITIDKTKNLVFADGALLGSLYADKMVMSKINGASPSYNPYSEVYSEPKADAKFYDEFWKRKPVDNDVMSDQIDTTLSSDADASVWFNMYGAISKASNGYIETLAVNKLLVNSAIGADLNFEDGKMVINSKTHFNDELKKVIEKYYDDNDADFGMLKSIETDDANSYSVGYLSLDFVKYFIKEAGFESTVNNYMQSTGLVLDDVVNAFSGDYGVVNYQETQTQTDPYYGMSYSRPVMVVALGLNGSKANKVLNFINDQSELLSAGTFYQSKELLAFSSDETKLALLKAGKSAKNAKMKKESGVNSFFWSSGSAMDDLAKRAAKTPKFKIVDMISTSEINDGSFTSQITINLDKKDKNALHYLLGYE